MNPYDFSALGTEAVAFTFRFQVPAGDPHNRSTDEEVVVKQPCHLGKHNGCSIRTIKKRSDSIYRELCI